MDQKTFELENIHVKSTVEKVKEAKKVLEKSMEQMGAHNLSRLRDLRENPETEPHDILLFMDTLHNKNAAFNFKDKFKRIEEMKSLIDEPYFSRIDLKDSDEIQTLYIGKFGHTGEKPVIIDWRAKIASVYYKYRYPQKNVTYDTPDGLETRNLTLKRTFEIDKGSLIKYYNNDIQLDENEIIADKLAKRTGGVLEDIIETIQQSQMDVIESDPRQICIVQGCVGSGKSTVAIHKLSHIFFNYPELIHPQRSILIAKNQILVGYLSTLFPKLGIFDIEYKTLRDLIYNLVFREDLKINIDFDLADDRTVELKEIELIERKINKIHEDYEKEIDVVFAETESFGGYKYNPKQSVYDNLTEIVDDLEEELKLQREYLDENPNSLRSDTYKENIKVLKRLVNQVKKLRVKLKETTLLDLAKELRLPVNQKMSYIQTLLYAFIYAEIIGISKSFIYEYCIVDEGQDFNLLEYLILGRLVLRGRMCILGDLNQAVLEGSLTGWEEINKVIPDAKNAKVFQLETNYRSTKPIIEFATKLLAPYTKKYLPKSIERKGSNPVIKMCDTYNDMLNLFEGDIKEDLKNLDKSIGIICFSTEMFNNVDAVLKNQKIKGEQYIKLDAKQRIKYLPQGVYLTMFENCKGLEFSKVYVLGINPDNIKGYEQAKKAYVAVTRAMNELIILDTISK